MDVEMERRINISQGEQIGLKKGEQIGQEKGLKKEKMETTKKLLQLGTMPLEQISFVTGLNIEEIRKIENKTSS